MNALIPLLLLALPTGAFARTLDLSSARSALFQAANAEGMDSASDSIPSFTSSEVRSDSDTPHVPLRFVESPSALAGPPEAPRATNGGEVETAGTQETPPPTPSTGLDAGARASADEATGELFDETRAQALAAAAVQVADEMRSVGACYAGVARALHRAGILDFNTGWKPLGIGEGSAYMFGDWARKNPERAASIGLKTLPVPSDLSTLRPGTILVYAAGACGFNADHGHIEVVVGGGHGNCSDHCGEELRKNCIASSPEKITIVIPVK